VEEIDLKYQLQMYAQNLSNPADIRTINGIPPHEKARLEMAARQAERDAITGVMKDTFQRLHAPIEHMANTLKAYDADPENQKGKKLFASLVENIAEMVEVAERLNICNDPTLAQYAQAARQLIDGVTIADVKESEGMRKTLAAEADRIAAALKEWT
jgi:hypothetical protein